MIQNETVLAILKRHLLQLRVEYDEINILVKNIEDDGERHFLISSIINKKK